MKKAFRKRASRLFARVEPDLGIGDHVTWESASQGISKVKYGTVYAVVPADTTPAEAVIKSKGINIKDTHCEARFMSDNITMGRRSKKSYLVAVKVANIERLYWPHVSGLKLVKR